MGAGPDGYDNGLKSACTGVLGAGNVATLCVNTAAAAGGNGTSATPYKTIQSAITAGKKDDIIQVAEGTYAENVVVGTSFNGAGPKAMNLRGGFRNGDWTTRDARLYKSIINGGATLPALQIYVNASMYVDGFAITNGKGLGTDYTNGYGHGGGIYVQPAGSAVITLSHNEVYGNQTKVVGANSMQGGGIHSQMQYGATGGVRLEDNYVHDNLAGKGAGVHIDGGTANTMIRNRVENNIGHSDHGGGVYISGGLTFTKNLIKGNETGRTAGYGWGGGMIVDSSAITASGNVFTDNYAPTIGSGLFLDERATGTMKNDIYYRNRCPGDARSGTAIYLDGSDGTTVGSVVSFENLTIANHSCSGMTGGAVFIERKSTANFKNTIFWGNTKDTYVEGGGNPSTLNVTYSITALAGTGNTNVNPQFVDSSGDDYHLKSTAGHYTSGGWATDASNSPAIDAGDPSSSYANEPAPNGSRVNLGFYGNTVEASKTP